MQIELDWFLLSVPGLRAAASTAPWAELPPGLGPGFEISAKFRRISVKFFVSARYRKKIFRYFRKILF